MSEVRQTVLTRRQSLTLFVLAVLVFALLAWRIQVNTAATERNRQEQQYQGCLGGVTILKQFDDFVNGMALVELEGTKPSSPTYDKSAVPTRLQRAALYRGAFIPIPDCQKP